MNDELQAILESHKKWVDGNGGERANLRGADLIGADLRWAKNAPLIITGLEWVVIIDGIGNMRIGCQLHSIEEWSGFDDQTIQKMASSALEFWYRHKPMLLAMCDRYKHPSDGGAV